MANNPLQIIFLYDLNSFSDLRPRSGPELHRKLLCLRLSCLRILTHYSNCVPSLKWGFKFFDSRGKITQSMCKFFFPSVTLESYETLENEITSQFLRHASYLEALAESSDQNSILCLDTNVDSPNQNSTIPVQLLQLALNEMLGEFQWETSVDAFSPCVRSRRKKEKRNLLFYFSKCARDKTEFKEFFGSDFSSVNCNKLSKLLLSQTLHEQLLDQASIQWIWLNMLENISPKVNSESEILEMMSEALKSMDCTLIPLSALPQPTQVLKFRKEKNGDSIETCNITEFNCSILPFSSIFLQSISYPFYSNNEKNLFSESAIIFDEKNYTIPILINSVPLSWNREESNLSEDGNSSQMQCWSKINACFAVPRHTQVKSCGMCLCVPNISTDTSNCQIFQQLNVNLFVNNVSLFIVCESTWGMRPGLYTPLTNTSALISILTEKSCCFLTEKKVSDRTYCIKDSSLLEVQKKVEKCFPNLVLNFGDRMEQLNFIQPLFCPFQLECLEPWYKPQSIPSVFQKVNLQETSSTVVDDFQLQLLKSIKKEDNIEKESAEQTDATETSVLIAEPEEIPNDIQYEDLVTRLLNMFNSVLESNKNILQTAKRIIKFASSFFLQQSMISHEENLKNFMAEFFLTTCPKLYEKYISSEDLDTSEKIVIECQMQVFLYLEMEILFPSMDGSTCVKTVTDFLRNMSFYSVPMELNKFLFHVLKPNYDQILGPILIEIGDELGMPLYSDEDSVEDISGPQSYQSSHENLDSASLSAISASSISSNKGDKKRLPRKRSDICDTRKSHQVLLPTKSPRKKKGKSILSEDKIPIRYSPRLASKRKKELCRSTDSKPGSVRRNLFPKDKKPQTPRKSKYQSSPFKKATTPKGHHVLKTKFVPETPAYKQRHSAIYRRMSKSFVTPSKKVADSPSTTEKAKGRHILKSPANKQRHSPIDKKMSHVDDTPSKEVVDDSPSIATKAKDTSHLELLLQLKNRNLQPAANLPSTSATFSLPSCSDQAAKTPQSKRRLSLKLFSKIFTSPSVRMGFKKCSKRLFEEDSPKTDSRSKRMKLF